MIKRIFIPFFIILGLLIYFTSDFRKGYRAFQNTEYEKAYNLFLKSANEGDARAEYNLGAMFYSGEGGKQDLKKSFEWFEKSAKNGNAKAAYNIGFMYLNAQGVDRSLEKSIKWYRISANKDYAIAQYVLGEINYTGIGIKQNYERAFYWYERSANNGFQLAQIKLGYMYNNLQGISVRDQKQADKWIKKAIENDGFKKDIYNIGKLIKY